MKKSNVCEIICITVVSVLLLAFSSELLKRKDSYREYRSFYEKAADYEVLFFGASVVHCSISPMQLWHDYGITSYNMANDSERLTMTYYDIVNSLDHASPKVIVVDLTSLRWAGDTRDNTFKDHNFLDAVPLSENKIKEVKELFRKDEYMEYLFPFTLYHSRWSELTEEDFDVDYNNYLYGAKLKKSSSPPKEPPEEDYEPQPLSELEKEGMVIQQMIDLCREHDIDIVFTCLPTRKTGMDQQLRDFCKSFLLERGAVFIDMQQIDSMDYQKDFLDTLHVNYDGAVKITDLIGRFLTDNYRLTDHRSDKELSDSWNSNYTLYTEYLMEQDERIKQKDG